VLTPVAEFCYKCDDFYRPEEEGGIPWNDPMVSIVWPEVGCEVCLSEKDKRNRRLGEEKVFL
jgi:dTDP-4-dehydrorhamnose 3,5-epimerase